MLKYFTQCLQQYGNLCGLMLSVGEFLKVTAMSQQTHRYKCLKRSIEKVITYTLLLDITMVTILANVREAKALKDAAQKEYEQDEKRARVQEEAIRQVNQKMADKAMTVN